MMRKVCYGVENSQTSSNSKSQNFFLEILSENSEKVKAKIAKLEGYAKSGLLIQAKQKRCETKQKHAKKVYLFRNKKQKSCETVCISLPFRMKANKKLWGKRDTLAVATSHF
jgi:hypothetical protein